MNCYKVEIVVSERGSKSIEYHTWLANDESHARGKGNRYCIDMENAFLDKGLKRTKLYSVSNITLVNRSQCV